jgi:predicted CoA-binding protein
MASEAHIVWRIGKAYGFVKKYMHRGMGSVLAGLSAIIEGMNEPSVIREILDETETIAVVGLSDKEGRASYGVSRFMQGRGYRIIPVNPLIESSLGERAYPTIEAAAEGAGKIDLVNVFRAPEFVPEVVKETIRLGIPYLWLQEGVVHDEAAEMAENAGIKVVMDRCILKERMAAGWE